MNELKDFHGIGEVKAGQIKSLFEFCRRFSQNSQEKAEKIKTYEDALDYFRPALAHKEEENLAMICLDSNNRVLNKDIENSIIAKGSIDKVNVEFRRVVKKHYLVSISYQFSDFLDQSSSVSSSTQCSRFN